MLKRITIDLAEDKFLWLVNGIYYLLLGYFSFLMILITVQYVPINLDVAFLHIKQEEIALQHYQVAFFSHVYSSVFVLLEDLLSFRIS